MYKRKPVVAAPKPRKKLAVDFIPKTKVYCFPGIATGNRRGGGSSSRSKDSSCGADQINPAATVNGQAEGLNAPQQEKFEDLDADHIDEDSAAQQPPSGPSAPYFATTTCNDSRPQTKRETNHDRYKAVERNWDSFDHAAPELLLNQLPTLQQTWQLTCSSDQQRTQDAACQGECDKCGCSTSECEVLRQVPVVVFDQLACYSIEVTVYQCNRCKTAVSMQNTQQPQDMRQQQQQQQQQQQGQTNVAEQQQEPHEQQEGPHRHDIDDEGTEGLLRHPFMFNIHPIVAGCFPATPVHGIYLHRAHKDAPQLWFKLPLLLHLYCQRKHIQRLALSKAAAAQQAFYQHQPHSTFPVQVTSDRFRQALSTALDHFTEMWERAALQVRPPEGLAAACTVCRRGHLQFLMEQKIDGHAAVGAVSAQGGQDRQGSPCSMVARQPTEGTQRPTAGMPGVTAATSTTAAAATGTGGSAAAAAAVASAATTAAPNTSAAGAAASDSSPAAAAVDVDAAAPAEAAASAPFAPGRGPGSGPAHTPESPGSTVPPQAQSTSGDSAAPAADDVAAAGSRGQPSMARAVYTAAGAALLLHSVMIDGLQKVRHFQKAGRASGFLPPISMRLLPDSDFNTWEDEHDAAAHDAAAVSLSADPCHTFKADSTTGRRSEMFDKSGIVTLLCRHGFLLAAINMPTGERWAFATFLLHVLIHEHNILPYIVMYDINCRYKVHFKRWVETRSCWTKQQKEYALEVMQMPLPPFHAHMHMASCQAQNSLKQVPAGGTGIGEPTEQMNRFLGLAGVVLQYTTLAARALWLEVLFRQWNHLKYLDLPHLLVRSGFRALAKKEQLNEQQTAAYKQAKRVAQEGNLDWTLLKHQVCSWSQCGSLEMKDMVSPMSWEAEAAELQLQLKTWQYQENGWLPKHLVGQDLGLHPRTLANKQQRLEHLQKEHPELCSWTPESPSFVEAVSLLCQSKVAAWQLRAEQLMRQHQTLVWMQRTAGDNRRTELKLMRKQVTQLCRDMQSAVMTAAEWEQQRCRYHHQQQQQAQQQSTGDAWHTMPAQKLLQSLLEGCLPWTVAGNSNSSSGQSQDFRLSRIELEMKMRAFDLRAAQQELDLIAFEIDSYKLGVAEEGEELQQAIEQQQTVLAQQLQQQQVLEDLLLREPESQHYKLHCMLKRADMLASIAQGRILLLQQLLCKVINQQAAASKAFNRYLCSTGDKRAIAVGAAAAFACTDANDAGADDADPGSDAEPDTEEEDADADAGQGADVPVGIAAAAGTSVGAELGPLMRWVPVIGPDPVLYGAYTQPWGLQGCPWQVDEAALQQYHLFIAGSWPASLSAAAAGAVLQTPAAAFTAADVRRCLPGKWLNDELINFGMWLLQQRDAAIQGCMVMQPCDTGLWDRQQGISCHFFNSYFFSKLYLDGGVIRYGAVRRWTLPGRLRQSGQPKHAMGVLDCELLVAPCNLNNTHWVLVVADLKRRQILYLDPMGGRRPDIANAMAVWVQLEACDKRQQCWDTSTWPRLYPRCIPQQVDGSSCGLYALVLAECLGAGLPLEHCTMTDKDAEAVRARLLQQISSIVARMSAS